jgi:hypothetical protein
VVADIEKDGIHTPQVPKQDKSDSRDVREGVQAWSKRKNIHRRKNARNQGPSIMFGGNIEEPPAILDPVPDQSEEVGGSPLKGASGTSPTPSSTMRKPTGPLVGQERNNAAIDTRSKRELMPSSGDSKRVRDTVQYGFRKRSVRKDGP